MRTPGASVTTAANPVTDAGFVEQLRFATQRYLDSIDAWETAYQKYYRLPTPGSVSSDLEAEHRDYLAARGELKRMIPNARRLCMRHSLRDPWPALMHINLESTTPQGGFTPAIGRAERGIIAKCLEDLEAASRPVDEAVSPRESPKIDTRIHRGRRNIFQRIADYFL
jgi:hypothetical protein